MVKQGDKTKKKAVKNIKENIVKEKAKPVADQREDREKGSLFSCGHCLMMICTVMVALVVTSLIVKTVELQTLNTEQDEVIKKIELEAENIKQLLQNRLSVSLEKTQADQILIKSLNSEKDDMNKQLEDLITKLTNNDKMVAKYHETQVHLQNVIEKKDEDITTLNDDLSVKINSLVAEKKTILENLKATGQEVSKLQQKYEVDLENSKAETEEVTKELNDAVSKQEKEMSLKLGTIENLKLEVKSLSGEKENILKSVESLKRELQQVSIEMVKKSETAESLHEQNMKLSSNLASFRDDSNRLIKDLEKEKNRSAEESERRHRYLLEEISKVEDRYKTLEEEKEIIELSMEDKLASLEIEHKDKLNSLENSKSQLMSSLESKMQEAIQVLEEKMSLAKVVEDLQLETKLISIELRETETKLEDCNIKMIQEIKLVQECKIEIDHLGQETSKIESDQVKITENKEK